MMLSTSDHHYFFREFIRLEQAIGGPDPHLDTLGHMIAEKTWDEKVWCCGLYALGYNVPTAEVIWGRYTRPLAVLEAPVDAAAWVAANWPGGYGLRRERRAVRTPAKFAKCLVSIAQWSYDVAQNKPSWWDDPDGFDQAWRSLSTIWGVGRYVLLKHVEALVRFCGGAFAQNDIRASGGASPREGLALLFPDESPWLTESASRNVRHTEDLAAFLKADLPESVSFFVLQVALCEYKKVQEGRQYVGSTHDSELKYWRHVADYWHNEDTTTFFTAREKTFYDVSLGEKRGWWGKREALERTLPDHGYLWCDLLHDYEQTTNFAKPILRDPPLTEPHGPAPKGAVNILPPSWNGEIERPHTKLRLRPCYAYEGGGQLFQTGAKNLDRTLAPDLGRAVTQNDINLAVACSTHINSDMAFYVRQIQIPFGDNSKFRGSLARLMPVVERVAEVIRRGGNVVVYCHYGINRSGFLNALIIRELERCTGTQALEKLRVLRKGAVGGNPHFVNYLKELEAP